MCTKSPQSFEEVLHDTNLCVSRSRLHLTNTIIMAPSRPYNEQMHNWCTQTYPDIEGSLMSFGQVFLTFLIIALSIAIEYIVRFKSFYYDPDPKPTTNGTPTPAKKIAPDIPLLHTRASRFAVASFKMVPLILAFVFRIKGTEVPDYPQKYIDNTNIEGLVWVAIAIFTIFPFSCACTAWLRSLVDCVLFRFGTSLKDTSDTIWPSCLPIMGPLKLIGKLKDLAMEGVLKAMQHPLEKRKEDIEMGSGEEGTALVENMERGDDEEVVELPPAYDEVGGSRNDLEAKSEAVV